MHPLQTAKPWSRTESKQVTIPQPFMIRHYNSTMGGVDRTDQNIGKYRTVIRCKKWWWLTALTSACSRPGTCTGAQMLQKTTLWICLPSAGVSPVSTLPELALLHLVVLGDLCPLTSVSHQRSGMTMLIISCRAGQHS